jgi:galactofuranosylgalactofuranosylrhamnosyl-N-acetylglucosaminyl-diphospho-decaprenol beta-1,5/1,6-galactofuranosyltransferase
VDVPGPAAPSRIRKAKKPMHGNTSVVAEASAQSKPVAQAPTGRLTAQRGLYAGPAPMVSKNLYAELEWGSAVRDRGGVTLEPSSRISGNTYFGRFPASYWQRWTTVTEVAVEAVVTGDGRVSVGASDVEGEPRVVAAEFVSDAKQQRVVLPAKLDKFHDGGAVWLDLETEAGQTLRVEQVRWTVAAPEVLRPTAVTICTMNRADDCLKNLQALAADMASLETLDAIYVADQGTDPVESRDGFEQVAKDLGEKLRYLRQPNLGGAGGFTRGLYEVAGNPATEHANVLFMDDDVLLEPDLVIRLTAFSNLQANPVIVGGQMLNLLHPNQLHVGAEYANLNTLEPGKPVKHSLETADLLGVDKETLKPNRQDRRLDAGYNGWWSCLIPYEVVQAIGYPMPFFFQWDDAEYSYRARARGFPTVTLPGAGVWHADFHWKDWDEWHRYFNLRNSIITAALHSPFNLNLVSRVLVAQIIRYLLGMQYGLTATLLKAVEDFLEGPEILRDGGVEAMKEIRRIRDAYPETKRHEATGVPGIASNDIGIINSAPPPSRPLLVMLKRLLHQTQGKQRHALGAVSADDAHWWHIAQFETAVVTDANQEGVRVRSYDRAKMLELARHGAKVINRLRKEGAAVQEQYKRALPELTSRENWTRLYGL